MKPPVPDARSQATTPFLTRRRAAWTVAALIVLHGLLLAYLATVTSVTYDEHAHLPAGVAYLKFGDYSIYNKSPPLLRWIAAAPALAAGAVVPPITAAYHQPRVEAQAMYGDAFMQANPGRYQELFVAGRRGMIPLSCLTAWLVYRWGRRLFGRTAGVAACAMYTICPNVLAHGPLVTTDVGSGTFFLLALWTWQRFAVAGSWRRLPAAVLAIGAAHLCKFTAFLIWPALVIAIVLQGLMQRDRRSGRRWVGLAAGVVGTTLIINAVYGFGTSGAKLNEYTFKSAFMQGAQRAIGGVPFPLPREFVRGFDLQKVESEGGFLGYLFGEFYHGSRWYYYPVALACKLPVSLLGLSGLGLVIGILRLVKRRQMGFEVLFLVIAMWGFALGLVGLAQLNIGVRYLLPIFPLGFILLGSLWSNVKQPENAPASIVKSPRLTVIGAALVIGMALESAAGFPHYLTYFNFASGGSSQGWRILGSSNYDWGQGLIGLADWMKRNDVPHIHLANFGPVDPADYGIHYTALDQPGNDKFVALSGHFLCGGQARFYTPTGVSREFLKLPFFRELQQKPLVARVGGSIFIFRSEDVAAAQTEFNAKSKPAGGPAHTAP